MRQFRRFMSQCIGKLEEAYQLHVVLLSSRVEPIKIKWTICLFNKSVNVRICGFAIMNTQHRESVWTSQLHCLTHRKIPAGRN